MPRGDPGRHALLCAPARRATPLAACEQHQRTCARSPSTWRRRALPVPAGPVAREPSLTYWHRHSAAYTRARPERP
eukprot:scaffold119431_cov78-Phaeocystis_antarctica.AAC.2